MMRKLFLIAAAATLFSLSHVSVAEARLWEPQADWLHAGRLCASTRGAPSRAGEALPARACRTETPAPAPRVRVAAEVAFREDSVCTRKRAANPDFELA